MKAYLLFKNNLFSYTLKSSLLFCNRQFNSSFERTLFNPFYNYHKCSFKISYAENSYRNLSSKKDIFSENCQHFSLSDYDCIGFDLDNTICEYKIDSLAQMEYEVLSKFLVEKKGYDENYLYAPLDSEAVDFFQRGLILDLKKGNILKLNENGVIIKASHGSKFLSEDSVKTIYGSSKTCELSENILNNLTLAWQEPFKQNYRLLLDYFDLPASLGFARAVDSRESGGNDDYPAVGQDLLSALIYMYSRDHFKTGESEFFRRVKANPQNYINKCSDKVIHWLKELRKNKKIFLVTGSNIDNASFTASNCLGDGWKDLFDIVICYACKPGFFEMDRPFFSLNGLNEGNELKKHNMKLGNAYSQGNWKDLYTVLCNNSSKKSRCLYIGDNFVEDVYAPRRNILCDTVAVSEELSAEGFCGNNHPSGNYIRSKKWGSCFIESGSLTLWGSVIDNYAKICIPSLNYLANFEIHQNIRSASKKYFTS